MVLLADNPLWQFSLDYYAVPENQIRLLRLQDTFGLNINVILSLLWYARISDTYISESLLHTIILTADKYNSSLSMPLRKLRKAIKHKHTQTYPCALTIEIFSEKIQQLVIYDIIKSSLEKFTPNTQQIMQAQAFYNLELYLQQKKIDNNIKALDLISQLVFKIF